MSWSPDTILFLLLTFTGAAWVVLQLALSLRAARARSLPMWLRWLGWLPPLTPIAEFWSGARIRALIWCIVAVAYLVLRTRA